MKSGCDSCCADGIYLVCRCRCGCARVRTVTRRSKTAVFVFTSRSPWSGLGSSSAIEGGWCLEAEAWQEKLNLGGRAKSWQQLMNLNVLFRSSSHWDADDAAIRRNRGLR